MLRTSTSSLTVRNLGSNPLTITSIEGKAAGIFKASFPTEAAATLQDLKVKVVFAPAEVKVYKDTLVIHTSAGDLQVVCECEADDLYYDDHALEADKVEALLSDGFENGVDANWQLLNDADGKGFVLTSTTEGYADETYQDAEAMVSYEGDGTLVTRSIEIPVEGQTFLDFYCYGNQAKGLVSCGEGDDVSTYDQILVDDLLVESWHNKTVDLTPYAGKTVRLAWKRDGAGSLLLDNVLVYHYDGVLNGVSDLNSGRNMGQPSSIEYYSVNGTRQNGLQSGVNIVKYHYADGTTVSRKVIRQ